MLTPLKVWRRLRDDIVCYLMALVGVLASKFIPLAVDVYANNAPWRWPLTLVQGGIAAGIALVVAYRMEQQGDQEAKRGKAAFKRRLAGHFTAGVTWQVIVGAAIQVAAKVSE